MDTPPPDWGTLAGSEVDFEFSKAVVADAGLSIAAAEDARAYDPDQDRFLAVVSVAEATRIELAD